MGDQAGRVRRYYNKNTAWMLLFGRGRGEAVIHRPVWLKENLSRREAAHTVDFLIAEALVREDRKSRGRQRILDLGCGVGGSAFWLAEHFPVDITGITVSPVQVQTARQLAIRRGLSDRCSFRIADFNLLPRLQGISGAYAVESFSHGDDGAAFFAQIGGLLPAGSRLVLCDDFLASEQLTSQRRREIWLSRFRAGWHLRTLIALEQALGMAAEQGFELVEKRSLTPYLRQTPPLLSSLQLSAGRLLKMTAWGSSMYGGSALQVCQKNGWTEYLFLVLEKG